MIDRRSLLTLNFDRPARETRWLRVHRRAMACRFEVMLAVSDADHMDAARAALDEADRLEAMLTLFRESSELSRINREGHIRPTHASHELFALLARCRELHTATSGAFDITTTPLSRCWGFLKRDGRIPAAVEIEVARAGVGMNRVTPRLRFGARVHRRARGDSAAGQDQDLTLARPRAMARSFPAACAAMEKRSLNGAPDHRLPVFISCFR